MEHFRVRVPLLSSRLSGALAQRMLPALQHADAREPWSNPAADIPGRVRRSRFRKYVAIRLFCTIGCIAEKPRDDDVIIFTPYSNNTNVKAT